MIGIITTCNSQLTRSRTNLLWCLLSSPEILARLSSAFALTQQISCLGALTFDSAYICHTRKKIMITIQNAYYTYYKNIYICTNGSGTNGLIFEGTTRFIRINKHCSDVLIHIQLNMPFYYLLAKRYGIGKQLTCQTYKKEKNLKRLGV